MKVVHSKLAFGLLSAACLVGLSNKLTAGVVTWSSPVILDTAGADFSNSNIVDAIYFGDNSGGSAVGPATTVVNGITFTSTGANGDSTITMGAIGGTTAFDYSRDDGTPSSYASYPLVQYVEDRTSASGAAETITLNNLVVGTTYEVQTLFSAGSAVTDSGPRNVTMASYTDGTYATSNATSPNIEYGVVAGSSNTSFYGAQVESGIFVATATSEYLSTPTGVGPGNRTEIAAVALSAPVPEPTSIGLIGAAVVGLLARRRRIA